MNRPAGVPRPGPVAAGTRSVAAERIDGVVVTGDGATVSVTVAGPGGFRLEVLGPSPEPGGGVPASQRSPSYLLDARRRVVPYRPRPVEQKALTAWRDGPARASVVLVHGPGGQGKTRLAGWLANDSHRQGWSVAQAVDRDAPQGADLARAVDGPLLVVVDYAERWPVQKLVRMVETVAARPGPARVALLARPLTGFWDGIEAELERCDVEVGEPIAARGFAGEAERTAAFAEAVEAFQKALGVPVSPVEAPPGVDDSPLSVHMAALAAVTAGQRGEPAPEAEELSRYLLRHERRYWSAVDHPADTIATTVLVAAVFGPAASASQARAWLRAAYVAGTDAQAAGLLRAHEHLYPAGPAPAGRESAVLWPLKPDRLAEDFIGAQLDRPQNAELLGELLTGEEMPATAVRHGLILLAAAARHRSVRTLLFPLLRDRAELAPQLTPPVIDAVIRYADRPTAEAVDARMPRFSTELLRPARDLAHHLLSTLPSDTTPAHRAGRLALLGLRLADVGDKRAALEAVREAVDLYQRLAATEPDTYLPRLGASLSDLGARLLEVGEKRAALASTREAAEIRRRLAEAEPSAHLPGLATSLTNLAICLAEVGDKEAALASARDAVDIHRRLAATEPDTYLHYLSGSLANLGARQAEVGDRRAAAESLREAADIRRRLAEAEPASHLPELARILNNLSTRLSEVGDKRGALEAVHEAVGIDRRLADDEPTAFLPDLANSLNNFGNALADVGDRRAALEPTRESADIYRGLAEAEPNLYQPALATALNNLGSRLADLGRKRAALEPTREAMEIRRRLARAEPSAYLADLARSLNNLGVRSSEVGDERAALESLREAAEIHRRLADAEPAVHLPELSTCLNNLSTSQAEAGDRQAALESVLEAADIGYRLAEAEPAAFLPGLAMSLNNLAVRLAEIGNFQAALEPAREAVEVHRRLAAAEPAAFLPGLAGSLGNLGAYLAEVGDREAALELVREATGILRRLAEAEPAYLPELAMSLWAGAWVRNAQNVEIDAALTAVDEAIAIYTKLAEDLPGYFERYLQAAQQTREDLTRRRQWPGRTPRTPG